MANEQRNQQQPLPPKAAPASLTPTLPDGMTAAWFTERELLELRKVCRDADSELGKRFLQAGIDRARDGGKGWVR